MSGSEHETHESDDRLLKRHKPDDADNLATDEQLVVIAVADPAQQPHDVVSADILDHLYSSDEEDYEPTANDPAGIPGAEQSDDSEDGEELLDWQEEILDAMEKSLEYPAEVAEWKGRKLVTISKEDANEIRTSLWKYGPLKFIHRRCIEDTSRPASELLAALGIRLPLDIVAQYSDEQLRPFLQIAVKFALSKRQRLDYPQNISQFCEVLEKAENVIVLTGAGISTSLGIPDFRSDNGLYARLAHLGLSDPQEVFDIHLFREDPSIFYSIARDVLPATSKFSPTHAFIKLLQDKNKLLRNYTQNIDNLEAFAGVDPEKLVQCHGSFATATCQTCRRKVPGEELFEEIRAGKVPKCSECWENGGPMQPSVKRANKSSDSEEEPDEDPAFGVMKPDITFFGEPLPSRFEDLLLGGDAKKCDLLICIGTSLKVAPVSEIVRVLPPTVPQIYISKTPVHHNEFDVTFLGNCDDVVELILEKMKWPFEHEMALRSRSCPEDPAKTEDMSVPGATVDYDETAATYRFAYAEELSSTHSTPEGEGNPTARLHMTQEQEEFVHGSKASEASRSERVDTELVDTTTCTAPQTTSRA